LSFSFSKENKNHAHIDGSGKSYLTSAVLAPSCPIFRGTGIIENINNLVLPP